MRRSNLGLRGYSPYSMNGVDSALCQTEILQMWSVTTKVLDSFYIVNLTENDGKQQRLRYCSNSTDPVDFLNVNMIQKENKYRIQTQIERLSLFVKKMTNLCVKLIHSFYMLELFYKKE